MVVTTYTTLTIATPLELGTKDFQLLNETALELFLVHSAIRSVTLRCVQTLHDLHP